MIFSAKLQTILFLQRKGFVLYLSGRTPGEAFEFSEKAVLKEEVVDRAVLKEAIKQFFVARKLHPGQLLIVLSQQVLFGKQIASSDPTQQQNELKVFLDEIPFEHISKRVFKIDSVLSVIATNKDLCESIVSCIRDLGWNVVAVVPVVLFGKIGIDNLLSGSDIQYIYKRQDLVKAGNFLETESNMNHEGILSGAAFENKNKKGGLRQRTVAIFIGVAIVLLVISILFLFFFGVFKW